MTSTYGSAGGGDPGDPMAHNARPEQKRLRIQVRGVDGAVHGAYFEQTRGHFACIW